MQLRREIEEANTEDASASNLLQPSSNISSALDYTFFLSNKQLIESKEFLCTTNEPEASIAANSGRFGSEKCASEARLAANKPLRSQFVPMPA